MNLLYNTAISLYGAAAQVVSLRSLKVRKMLRGQHRTADLLRRKLGDDATDPHYITTVRGMGFRFENAR